MQWIFDPKAEVWTLVFKGVMIGIKTPNNMPPRFPATPQTFYEIHKDLVQTDRNDVLK